MSDPSVLSREQVRSIDRIAVEKFGIPSIVLMENAGRSCAEFLLAEGVATSSPVCICCGKGNNGGDGFAMARHLEILGIPVEVLIFHDPEEFRGDAAINFQILAKSDIPIHQLSFPKDTAQLERHLKHASWLVDALLGTGAVGNLRSPYEIVIPEMNNAGRPIMAIDIPSGLDCDLGNPPDCGIVAQITVTLVAAKPGFRSTEGQLHCGKVVVGQIGIPRNLLSLVQAGPAFEESV
ncbi:NAD(P)H-hydrate epimerase [Planctomicrobium piriforme]|nr:NAD(P)H-hydrate epimerase [Planctomicrobium piriforme]